MLCDVSCDYSHVPFHHIRKIKINKKKRKIFKSKYTVTI